VWESVVFALTILAFIFIGLQIRPILESLEPQQRRQYFTVAAAVLATAIVVRIAWQLLVTAVVRLVRSSQRPRVEATFGGGLLIGWSGMRGIVTLAAALGLPERFPHRDLIVFASFSVVLGTLVIQGLTLRPLLRVLKLHDEDPVGREVRDARTRALEAGLAALDGDESKAAETVREELTAHLARTDRERRRHLAHAQLHRRALQAARREVLRMRDTNEIGDDAFHQVEEDLDWLDMAGGPDS
jgi:CPA1 family monovalent cation:H+ antiporter